MYEILVSFISLHWKGDIFSESKSIMVILIFFSFMGHAFQVLGCHPVVKWRPVLMKACEADESCDFLYYS